MMNALGESPFREISDPTPWVYQEGDDEPVQPETPHLLTALGIVMLVIASCFAMPALSATPALGYLMLLGVLNNLHRDFLPLGMVLLLIGYTPVVLQTVAGIGLLQRAPWSRRGSIIALLISVPLGAGICWAEMSWLRKVINAWRPESSPVSPAGVDPLRWYALVMIPLVVLLIYALTRPAVAEALTASLED